MTKFSSVDETQPSRRRGLDEFQPVAILRSKAARDVRKRRQRWRTGCALPVAILLVYFFAPFRTNILVLGTDDSPERGQLGRTDTIILTTILPLQPYIGMLGIPRDLWLPIPGVGEQRINTAYFFAEATQPGTGAAAAEETIRQNFGVTVDYYIVLHMLGLVSVIDALGGVDITLDEPLGGLSAGPHHLDGTQALALARERYTADDFSRMQQGQIIILAVMKKILNPLQWPRLPHVLAATSQALETNIPFWQWPRLGFALARAPLFGIDNRIISRALVVPFETGSGAQVLLPNWEAINPVLLEMFRE